MTTSITTSMGSTAAAAITSTRMSITMSMANIAAAAITSTRTSITTSMGSIAAAAITSTRTSITMSMVSIAAAAITSTRMSITTSMANTAAAATTTPMGIIMRTRCSAAGAWKQQIVILCKRFARSWKRWTAANMARFCVQKELCLRRMALGFILTMYRAKPMCVPAVQITPAVCA